MERFKKSRNFTAGIALFSGNRMLDEDVLAEVKRRFENRKDNETRIAMKKKKRLVELRSG